MTRAADTLQTRRNGTRRANLANQIDGANINPQFERSRRYQCAELSGFEFFLRHKPKFAGQAAVMRGHGLLSQTLGKMTCHALCQTSGIDEHKC